MTGAMYSGISGMRAHMQKLNVIGNNVANVNTLGFKAGFTTFKESLYTTTKSGSNGTNLMGGTNPIQIGYGATIGTVDLDMSTKNYVPTGKDMDCMIAGDGFFMVGDKVSAGTDPKNLQLTRVGNLSFKDGYLVDGYGNIVYGFCSVGNGATGGPENNYANADNPGQTKGVSTQLRPIELPYATLGTPADNSDPDNPIPAVPGGAAWYPGVDANGLTIPPEADGDIAYVDGVPQRVSLGGISISETGKITGTTKDGQEIVVGYVALASVDNPGGVTHQGGPYYRALDGAGNVRVSSIGGAVEGALNNAKPPDGTVAGTSPNDAILGSGTTTLVGGGLESSGTDVATEFSEMITTQRGYQANTRIITVTDAMLEELVNIKR